MGTMPAYLEVPGALESLRARGLRLGVLAQSTAHATDTVLRFAGLRDRFELVLSAQESGAYKPDLRPYRMAIERIGADGGDVVLRLHPLVGRRRRQARRHEDRLGRPPRALAARHRAAARLHGPRSGRGRGRHRHKACRLTTSDDCYTKAAGILLALRQTPTGGAEMEQNVSRRGFIGAAIGTGAAAAIDARVRARRTATATVTAAGAAASRSDRRGIQLYTMRAQDDRTRPTPAPSCAFLGRIGYTEVETAGHYGWTAAAVQERARRAGLRARRRPRRPGLPGHAGLGDRLPRDARVREGARPEVHRLRVVPVDARVPVRPARPRGTSSPRHLNTAGKIARRRVRPQFFYHNHDFEFLNRFGGRPPTTSCWRRPTARYVKFELDLFWITEGGANGVEYLSAPTRTGTSPTTSRTTSGATAQADGSDEADFEDVGPGMLDFPDLFDAGDGRGLDKHYFIEHDAPWLSHPDDTQAEFKTARGRDRVPAERALVRNSSCSLVSPASSGWNEIASRLSWRTATG